MCANISRRRFLQTTIGAVAGLVVGVAGGYYLGSSTAPQKATSSLSGTPALVQAAEEEGQVTVYTSFASDLMTKSAQPWADLLGIKVNVVRDAAGAMIAKLTSEEQAGTHIADIAFIDEAYAYPDLQSKGYFLNYPSPVYSDPNLPSALALPYYYVAARYLVNFGEYNTEVFPQAAKITAFEDTVNLAVKAIPNQIGTLSPSVFGTSGYFYAGLYQLWGDAKFKQVMTSLLNAGIKIYTDVPTFQNDIQRGELGWGFVEDSYRIYQAVTSGAPVGYTPFSDVGVVVDPTPMAIMASAPHPNAAKLFFNWFLSRLGQENMVEQTGVYSPRTDVSPPGFYQPLSNYKVMPIGQKASEWAQLSTQVQTTVGVLKQIGWPL